MFFLSAYKQFHFKETNTESSQRHITKYGQRKVTALTLVDLSAAFDAIDDSVLLVRLSNSYGISGTALT